MQQPRAIQFDILPNWVSFPRYSSQITPPEKNMYIVKEHNVDRLNTTLGMQAIYWETSKMCCCSLSHTTEVGTKDPAQH